MRFLQAAVLSAILVSCVTGSVRTRRYSSKSPTQEAALPNNYIPMESWPLSRFREGENVDSVLESNNIDYIAYFINEAGQANASTLHVLCEKDPVEVIGQVLERVNFPQDALVEVASSQEVACNPEKFLVVLNKITQKGQASAITNGIENLFHSKHRECIPPLLIAMRGKPLEEVAVKKAFEEVVKADVYEPGVLWCTFEHPVITHRVYAEGLFASAKHRLPNQTFRWLLEKADNGDLRAFQAKTGYADLRADLLASVDLAMPKTLDGRTRLSVPLPKNNPETPKKDASTSTNLGAFGHFHAYLTERDETAREFGYSAFKV